MDFGSNHLTESLDRITWPNQLIKTFINVILSYFKVSINWPIFRRLTEKFDQLIRSSEIRSTDPLSFHSVIDLLDNFFRHFTFLVKLVYFISYSIFLLWSQSADKLLIHSKLNSRILYTRSILPVGRYATMPD
jgi:hypothetical protein